ncbi:hypothetical protein EVAR_27335_1 [Eumeta japonica]|uniref:Uncharacterized protein n=1 Tax=Eumeta variegata TaxID=151549 RepID=A0A4C1UCE2_EUMVA|nr:hypothetical protein EVAR_27335_1 [Eumeta japonica]
MKEGKKKGKIIFLKYDKLVVKKSESTEEKRKREISSSPHSSDLQLKNQQTSMPFKGEYHLTNLTMDIENFKSVWPFEKSRLDFTIRKIGNITMAIAQIFTVVIADLDTSSPAVLTSLAPRLPPVSPRCPIGARLSHLSHDMTNKYLTITFRTLCRCRPQHEVSVLKAKPVVSLEAITLSSH